jgi:predicted dehydrogenase
MVLEVSARYPAHRREIRVLCERGVAMFSDADAGCVRVYRRHHGVDGDGLCEERLPISTEPPLLRELRAFVHHLEGGPPPRSSASDAAAIVATVTTLRHLAGADSVP